MGSFNIFQSGWFSDDSKVIQLFFAGGFLPPVHSALPWAKGISDSFWPLPHDEHLRSRPPSDSGGLCQGQNPWMARVSGEAVVVAGEWRMAMCGRLWRRFEDVLVAVFPGGSCEYMDQKGRGNTQYLSIKNGMWWKMMGCCVMLHHSYSSNRLKDVDALMLCAILEDEHTGNSVWSETPGRNSGHLLCSYQHLDCKELWLVCHSVVCFWCKAWWETRWWKHQNISRWLDMASISGCHGTCNSCWGSENRSDCRLNITMSGCLPLVSWGT